METEEANYNPDLNQNKNTWLFGEPPLNDYKAAEELIDRATEAIKERIRALSLNTNIDLSLRYDTSLLSNDNDVNVKTDDSTIVDQNSWITSDEELESVHHLCETLSPLSSNFEFNKDGKGEKMIDENSKPFHSTPKNKKTWSNRISHIDVSPISKSPFTPLAKRPPPRFYDIEEERNIEEKCKGFFEQMPSNSVLTEKNRRLCKNENQWKYLSKESTRVVQRIYEIGFFFDLRKARRMERHILAKMARSEARIFNLAKERFNLDSTTEVSRVIFVKMKLTVPGLVDMLSSRPKRHFSTSSTVLSQIPHPICKLITKWRSMEHSLSCLRTLMASVSVTDSRIRAKYENETISGRILSTEPNIQFVPKKPIFGKYSIRSMFRAPEGKLLLAADYCQLELRVLSELSSDPSLISILNESARTDPFEFIASRFAEECSDLNVDRNKAKQLCYAIIYGISANSLCSQMHLSTPEDAQQLINLFFRIFPCVKSWIDENIQKYLRTRVSETFLGRMITFEHGGTNCSEGRVARRCINYIIQGTASEIFRQALVNLECCLDVLDAEIVMQLHDEILMEIDENRLDKTSEILRKCMEQVFPEFSTKFPVKLSVGTDWGSLKPINS